MTLDQHNRMIQHLSERLPNSHVIQTHISSVIVTDDLVYKFKKPVDFGFLNYTELETRKFFCEEEIRLGSLGAEAFYIKTIAIYGTPEEPAFEPRSHVIDYAVVMHRFEEAMQFDHLLDERKIDHQEIDRLAMKIVQFHKHTKKFSFESRFGNPEVVLHYMQENVDQISTVLGVEEKTSVAALKDWMRKEHTRLTPLMMERKANGYVRECHGDLHLRNIAKYQEEVIFFDPIEFNEALRNIDVINDLAFLLMDLKARGEIGYAHRILTLYLEETGDYEAVALLPLYEVYRAMVRAKVAALQLSQLKNETEHLKVREVCSRYLKLAVTLTQSAPTFIAVMHGFSGSGKSVVALALAEHCGAIRLRSDSERLRLYHEKEARYSHEATQATYGHLGVLAKGLLGQHQSVLIDAASLKIWQRRKFQHLAVLLGIPFYIIHIETEESVIMQRLSSRASLSNDPSEATEAVVKEQFKTAEPFAEDEEKYVISVRTETVSEYHHDIERLRSVLCEKSKVL